MADIYVRSTDGLDTDDGSTWALAKATIAGAAAIAVAGDTIYVSQVSNDTATATLLFNGSANNPIKVLGVNDSAFPPTSLSLLASKSTTSTNPITLRGKAYIYGLIFICGSGGGTSFAIAGNDTDSLIFDSCIFRAAGTSTSIRLSVGNTTGGFESFARFVDCSFRFFATAQGFNLQGRPKVELHGGGLESGTSAITTFIATTPTELCNVSIQNFDFSNAAQALYIVGSVSANGSITLTNCRLPNSWTGGLVSGTISNQGFRISMYNCWYSDINYSLWIESYSGTIRDNSTVVKTGGSSDGTTSLSWKMTTNANANEFAAPLVSDDMAIWLDTTGTSKTITVDIIHDSVTALKDNEVWLEVDFLGSSATPLCSCLSDKRATVLTATQDQTASTATWTTTGLTDPNKQKLEVTFTNQMKGFVYARVYLAKPSYTIYVDYEPTVT